MAVPFSGFECSDKWVGVDGPVNVCLEDLSAVLITGMDETAFNLNVNLYFIVVFLPHHQI